MFGANETYTMTPTIQHTSQRIPPPEIEWIFQTNMEPTRRLVSPTQESTHDSDENINPQTEASPETSTINPFRIIDLPQEIQLHIFSFLLHRSSEQTPAERAALAKATLSMLLINKSFFRFFAPIRYQSAHIAFKDVIAFANGFLACCTDLCLENLRYLEYRLDFSALTQPSRIHLRKLTEVLSLYTELRHLSKFKIRYFPEYYRTIPDHVVSKYDIEELWAQADKERGGHFQILQRKALAKTLQGFSVTQGVILSNTGVYNGEYRVKEMSLTFRKDQAP